MLSDTGFKVYNALVILDRDSVFTAHLLDTDREDLLTQIRALMHDHDLFEQYRVY